MFSTFRVNYNYSERKFRYNQTENRMKALFNKFLNDESGATAIEYGLIAALVAIAAIVGMRSVGSELGTAFKNVGTELKANNVAK